MKSYDETISAVFDRIRTNEIEKQRKRKMAAKLITSLGCLCLVVAVCVGVWNIDFSSRPGDENKQVEYTLYHAISDSAMISKATELGISISSSDVLKFIDYPGETKQQSSTEKELKYSFRGNELDLVWLRTMENNLRNSKYESLKNLSSWDYYMTEDTNYTININSATKELRFYHYTEASKKESTNKLTYEEAKNIAYDILVEVYGKETANEYTAYPNIIESPGNSNICGILFCKYIGKYRIDDSISINLNYYGEISSINAKSKGNFDHLIGKLTEEQIIAAEEKVKEIFADQDVEPKVLQVVIDIDGNPYLSVSVTTTNKDSTKQSQRYYININ